MTNNFANNRRICPQCKGDLAAAAEAKRLAAQEAYGKATPATLGLIGFGGIVLGLARRKKVLDIVPALAYTLVS